MAIIKVIFKGHNDVLLADYNGKRYAFHKDKPVEVDEAVYKYMVQSGNVDAFDLKIYEEPKKIMDEKQQSPIDIVKETTKNVIEKAKHYKKRGRK